MSALAKPNYDYEYENQRSTQPKVKKRVIKKKKKNKINLSVVKNCFIFAIMFALGGLIVYNDAAITEIKTSITKTEEEIAQYNSKIDEYNIFLESLNNTNTIENVAKSYLGMNYPTRKQTVFLDVAYAEAEEKKQDKENNLLDLASKIFQ